MKIYFRSVQGIKTFKKIRQFGKMFKKMSSKGVSFWP